MEKAFNIYKVSSTVETNMSQVGDFICKKNIVYIGSKNKCIVFLSFAFLYFKYWSKNVTALNNELLLTSVFRETRLQSLK